jgi:hypothetical protein
VPVTQRQGLPRYVLLESLTDRIVALPVTHKPPFHLRPTGRPSAAYQTIARAGIAARTSVQAAIPADL